MARRRDGAVVVERVLPTEVDKVRTGLVGWAPGELMTTVGASATATVGEAADTITYAHLPDRRSQRLLTRDRRARRFPLRTVDTLTVTLTAVTATATRVRLRAAPRPHGARRLLDLWLPALLVAAVAGLAAAATESRPLLVIAAAVTIAGFAFGAQRLLAERRTSAERIEAGLHALLHRLAGH